MLTDLTGRVVGELTSDGADVPVIPEYAPAASVGSVVGDLGRCFEAHCGFCGMCETGEAQDCNCGCGDSFHFLDLSSLEGTHEISYTTISNNFSRVI